MKHFLSSLLISVLLISCSSNISKDKLVSKVRTDINTELQKRGASYDVQIEINSFDLIHKGGKEYSGILKTIEDGDEYTYQVDVTVDGDAYMWKIID